MGNKSRNLKCCYFPPLTVVYNFSEIESNLSSPFWDHARVADSYVAFTKWRYVFPSFYTYGSKTMSWKFHRLCTKSFGYSAKCNHISTFHNDSSTMFMNTVGKLGNLVSYFSNNVANKYSRGLNISRTLKSSIFYKKNVLSCTWHIS